MNFPSTASDKTTSSGILPLGRAGFRPSFPDPRRSRNIELSSQYPACVAAESVGRSPRMAVEHYLFATDEDIAKATSSPSVETVPSPSEEYGPKKTGHKMTTN